MAKDPICGMDVSEKGARHMFHFEHETLYFCSQKCKETYSLKTGLAKPATKKGVIRRFLEKLAKGNEQSYGSKPLQCH